MIFDVIYRRNLWNGVESRSGPGSGSAATDPVRTELLALIERLRIRSVLDVGCGDGFWMPDLPGYIGVDPTREAIAIAKRRHPDRVYLVGDLGTLGLNPFDLVICRDVIQHLSLADGQQLIRDITETGSRWLLASTYAGLANIDVQSGGFYSPDLTAPPFLLPVPELVIRDGYAYDGSGEVRDPAKFLGLWSLR